LSGIGLGFEKVFQIDQPIVVLSNNPKGVEVVLVRIGVDDECGGIVQVSNGLVDPNAGTPVFLLGVGVEVTEGAGGNIQVIPVEGIIHHVLGCFFEIVGQGGLDEISRGIQVVFRAGFYFFILTGDED
jgi:hypothetical protein